MGSKLKSLKLRNFGNFTDFELEFDSHITRLVGVNGSGKTTVGLISIWAGLRGIAENNKSGQLIAERFRFIGPAGKSSDIEITVVDEKTGATVTITNHITAAGNSISFESTAAGISDEWVRNLLDASFMSAKNFTDLSARQQALLLGIDTGNLDAEMKKLKAGATEINAAIKRLGTKEPVAPVEPVDIPALYKARTEAIRFNDKQDRATEATIRESRKVDAFSDGLKAEKERFDKHMNGISTMIEPQEKKDTAALQSEIARLQADLKEAIIFNEAQDASRNAQDRAIADIKNYERDIAEGKAALAEMTRGLSEMPMPQDKKDISELDAAIEAGEAQNRQQEAYKAFAAWKASRDTLEAEQAANKAEQEACESWRVSFIKQFSLPFDGLSIDSEGGLLLNGRPICEPYYSRGEREIIVAKLHASINPELKVRFVDDFETLDEDNQQRLLDYLIEAGFQIITAEVGKKSTKPNTVLLRECRQVAGYTEKGEKLL